MSCRRHENNNQSNNILEGIQDIREGLRDIQEGTRDIEEGLRDIREGTRDIERGLNEIIESLCDLMNDNGGINNNGRFRDSSEFGRNDEDRDFEQLDAASGFADNNRTTRTRYNNNNNVGARSVSLLNGTNGVCW